MEALDHLLAAHPTLVRQRSDRDHHATLLHYVSANGVEGYRQHTPANIVEIGRRLLDAGAEVDAEADVYGGGWTTLGLVVTSTPPRKAGVQLALAGLLLERGARIRPDIVRNCLANGCPEAAEYLAQRGAPVDLEGAAGLGRVDLVGKYFAPSKSISPAEGAQALIMAAWYGQRDVTAFLLDHGVDAAARHPKDDNTALHIAAYSGHAALVQLLLERGAPIDVVDGPYHTPPLVWALHAWLVENREPADAYRRVLRLLAEAGATVKQQWIDDDRVRADPELYALLSQRAGEAQ
jgi:hypothetical protein